MLLSHRLTHSRISAFIALLAIGLLFIAPDISKILEQQRMSAYDGMRMGMHEMMMPQGSNGSPREASSQNAALQPDVNGLAPGNSALTGDWPQHHSGPATPAHTAATDHRPSGHRLYSETQKQHRAEPEGETAGTYPHHAGTVTPAAANEGLGDHYQHHGAATKLPETQPVAHDHNHPAGDDPAPAATYQPSTANNDHAGMKGSAMSSMPGMDHSAMGGMSDFSCGYCELLVHLPMLVWIFIPLLWLILLTSRLPPPLTLPAYPLCWFPGTSQPRAPPHA